MKFDLDLCIHIATHLQNQDYVRATIKPDDIPNQTDDDETWQRSERLKAHLLLMQDAGWLDSVGIFNVAGTWKARLTYQGHLWLDASTNESIMTRVRQEVLNHGLRATNIVMAETFKGIVSAASS